MLDRPRSRGPARRKQARSHPSREALRAQLRDQLASSLTNERLAQRLEQFSTSPSHLMLALVDVARDQAAELDSFHQLMAEHCIDDIFDLAFVLADASRER